jgi:hypothetical protein
MEAASALVKKRLQADAGDPLFRLYRWRIDECMEEHLRDEARIELEEILAEATRRKEEPTVRQVRQQLDALKLSPPLPGGSFGEGLPLEDEFEDLPDFGGGIPPPDEFLGGLPPQELKMMTNIIEMIANASDRELKRLKQTRPRGMPAELFDLFAEMARGKRSRSNTGFPPASFPPPPSRPPKSKPPTDPNQAELF